MGLTVYNTLTRRVEPFEPLAPPRVTIYTCGPTVWSYAHLGNFRTFVFGDLLRRYLEYSGYDVFQVMNLTDVDDRIITVAGDGGTSLADHTQPFVDAFFEDRDYFRIKPANVYPRATESIPEMIELVESLLRRGLAYSGEDGSVYFAVDAFKEYGRLSQLDRRQLKAGARVAADEYDKEDVRDFALWKAASEVDEAVGAAWDAPFGRGRPGWHLECSAMALGELRRRFAVDTLDVHAGGVDLIFPHHENEIAQSEGATGKPFARYWLHGEFLTVEGTKMAKRFGNFLTARDFQAEGVDAGSLRLAMFGTHYRQRLNFTDDGLKGAREGAGRIAELRDRLKDAVGGRTGAGAGAGAASAKACPEAAGELEREFRGAMDDDLNAPRAVAALFGFVRRVNRELDEKGWGAAEAAQGLATLDGVLEVLQILPNPQGVDEAFAAWVDERIGARQRARAERDFAVADAIRAELAERGVELEDTPAGTRWRSVRP